MDENFFLGYRKTAIKEEEVLISVLFPFTVKVCIQRRGLDRFWGDIGRLCRT